MKLENYNITNSEKSEANLSKTNENNLKENYTKEDLDFVYENNFSETSAREKINESWKIEIPKINLIAQIHEGTTEDILNKYVGHFIETPKEKGNVGLAAHNRGYSVNYFNRLKELEIDDEIIYTYQGIKRVYKIASKAIIKDTDWSFLVNSKDNRLTLITCVENKPQYRRCVQAIEINN